MQGHKGLSRGLSFGKVSVTPRITNGMPNVPCFGRDLVSPCTPSVVERTPIVQRSAGLVLVVLWASHLWATLLL